MTRRSPSLLAQSALFRMMPIAFVAVAALAVSARAEPITLFAAASLKGALDEAAQSYEEGYGQEIRISYAGSSVLARQITLGAPADLFISANEGWMDVVEDSGHIVPGTRVDLLGNTLVVIAPTATSGPENLDDLAGFLGDRKIAIGLVGAVPAGIYGKAALEHLGQWDAVSPLAAQTDSVRAALALVALNQTPLGVVYGSDAKAEPRVRIVATLAPDSHPPIVYPAAVVADRNKDTASAFLRWLSQPLATDIFRRHGFTPMAGS
ncbi:molybdate ABC transporter substrate-binding protein [Aliiroseovarius sp. 2305UL8-7]|uniref:molybdate ABC transporter substrate-binding protein n=1 Tax=Aliiroseovarius conchicola TaxID=3121637 RepID=UPI003527CC23